MKSLDNYINTKTNSYNIINLIVCLWFSTFLYAGWILWSVNANNSLLVNTTMPNVNFEEYAVFHDAYNCEKYAS